VVDRWRVVNTARGLAVAEASRSHFKGIREMKSKAIPRAAGDGGVRDVKVKVIGGYNFTGPRGARLQLRLRHHRNLNRFRVRWVRLDAKGATDNGCTEDTANEPDARAALEDARVRAEKNGWVSAPVSGGRSVTFKPIPPA